MEEVDTITVAVSGIDINKVEPLDTRRLVTFINHYLATTVSFLNHFATQCESKLDRMQQQLHRVECRLKLLECKLASIPGIPSTPTVEGTSNSAAKSSSSSNPVPGSSSSSTSDLADVSNLHASENTVPISEHPTPPSKVQSEDGSDDGQQEDEAKSGTNTSASAKDDPRYAKYFKMVTVGVPIPAVKQKMLSEGVDPTVLDS